MSGPNTRLRSPTLVWFLSECSRTWRRRTVRCLYRMQNREGCVTTYLIVFSVYTTYVGVYVIDILQAYSAVTGYTRGSYSIRSWGVPQQLQEQHALLSFLSWAYLPCVLFTLLFQRHGKLSRSILRFSFRLPRCLRGPSQFTWRTQSCHFDDPRSFTFWTSISTTIYFRNMASNWGEPERAPH